MYDEVPTNTATLEGGRDQVTGGSWYPEVDLVIIAEAWKSTVTWSDSDKYAGAGNPTCSFFPALNIIGAGISYFPAFLPSIGISDRLRPAIVQL